MSDYRGDGTHTDGARRVDVGPSHGHVHHERRGGGIGRWLLILLALLAILAAIGFATGFFRADTSGELKAPDVDVSVKGGSVPDVDLDAKKVELETKTETVNITTPTLEVSEGKDDKDGPDNN
ncbi:hypothetical protein [Sphingomonas lenta]|uniref:Uncharacterized protein n=1 Tax=Sphingomonas lenta TaxID=1141887 RepID=A0A2A2SJH6_9SPHN|nr:hypothetical protein [Sphingomonas lenta]PAX09392.1 hypothetical protein CKY28_01155 [Sphingomonas lenta]